MLDIIIELIIDIFFAASEGVATNRRFPALIRYPLMILSIFIAAFLVAGSILFGVSCIKEGIDFAGYLFIVLGCVFAVIIVAMFVIAYNRKDSHVVTNNEGIRRDFEIISKGTPVNNDPVKTENKNTGALGRIGVFLFIVSLTLIVLLLILVY